jgi:hypothetical protein
LLLLLLLLWFDTHHLLKLCPGSSTGLDNPAACC